jgi:hypothetical protein
MSSKEAEFTADGRGTRACGFGVSRTVAIEQGLEVTVAKARHGPLAAADGLQKGGIGRIEWVESAVTATVLSERSAEVGRRLGQGVPCCGAGQRI